jgi:hypothetical protein
MDVKPQQPASTQQPEAVVTPVKKKSNKVVLFGLLAFTCLGVLVVGILAVLYITNVGGIRTLISPVQKYQSQTEIEELGSFTNDYVKSVAQLLDFSKISKDNPADIIQQDKSADLLKLEEKLNKLASSPTNLRNKVVQLALDLNLNTDAKTKQNVTLTSDIYVQAPNYDSKWDTNDSTKLNDLIRNMTVDELNSLLPKAFLTGSIMIDTDGKKISGKIDLTYVDKVFYIKLYDLNLPSDSSMDQLKMINNQVFKLDTSSVFDKYAEQVLYVLKNSPAKQSLGQGDLMSELNTSLKASLRDVSTSDIEMIKRIGNPIRDAVVDAITQVTLFNNVTTAKPIRDNSGSICSKGDVNYIGLIDSFGNAAVKIYNIVSKDPNFKAPKTTVSFEDQVKSAIGYLKESISSNNITAGVTMCSNNSFPGMSGAGFNFKFTLPAKVYSTTFDGDLNLLVVSRNSDKKIETPSFDVDLTNQMLQSLENLDNGYSNYVSP